MVAANGVTNPTPRVFTCAGCGRATPAGRRGPLPRRCLACTDDPVDALRYRIATARNLAIGVNRADVAAALDRAGELLMPRNGQ